MNKEKLKKTYSDFKENLSVILLLPTILGGIWQLLELSSLSMSFIRFFSLSQLIADGILILFTLTIFFASYKIVGNLFSKNSFKINSQNPPPLSYGLTLIALTVLIFIVVVFPFLKDIYQKETIRVGEIAILISCLVMTIGGFVIGIISLIEFLLNKKIDTIKQHSSNKWIKFPLEILVKVLIVFLFFWFLKFIIIDLNPHLSSFRHSMLFPDNILNKELLEEKIVKDNNLKFKPNLLYNNDKYFFYEIIDNKKNNRILIVDFTALIYK